MLSVVKIFLTVSPALKDSKMATYKYTAWDDAGTRKQGSMQSDSQQTVVNWLREHKLTPVQVDIIAPESKIKKKGSRRIKSLDIAGFCWQISTMIEGGVPIITALKTIAEDMENSKLMNIINSLAEDMSSGESFSTAVAKHPKVFGNLFHAMIVAGESGGTLVESLKNLADYYDSRDQLIRKVKGAISYPIFVISFVALIIVVMMVFVIPRFRTIFDQIQGKLPAFTLGFIACYDWIVHNVVYLFIGAALIVFGMIWYNKTSSGHYFFSKASLKIPIIGKIIHQSFVAIFCRTLSTLLNAGVPILDSLGILAGLTNNDVIRNAILYTKEKITEGSSIAVGMTASEIFPNIAIKMAQVGEESGSLPEVLRRTCMYYERKVDSLITTLTTLLEPALIITVGSIVLVVLLALYLPVFSISDIHQ